MSDAIETILAQNQRWARRKQEHAADYFAELVKGQSPPICWVGCCDSRVAPTEICQCALGDLFVQTNIANQVRARDVNATSSLGYAIDVLRVRHLVICGHTDCGGVAAAMRDDTDADDLPLGVAEWIAPMRELYRANESALPRGDDFARATEMSRINVRHQVRAAAELEVIRSVRAANQNLTIHGWLFHLESGTIETMEKVVF
ncbi:MAG: carbonic anhydrase [bacterium]